MSDGQIARVYAQALFDAAAEAGTIERTGVDLRGFVHALGESPGLSDVVFNPQIDPGARRRVMTRLTEEADRLVAGALAVLLEKGRIELVGEVADRYDDLADEAADIVAVEVTTAVPVGSAVGQRVEACVLRKTGLQARVESRVDPSIIGGLVLRIGDVIIDGSLRSRIRQLDRRLRSAEVRGDAQ
ncbi:MAG: ATP synthase F1 subunit delta [Thermoleophilia bacterium]